MSVDVPRSRRLRLAVVGIGCENCTYSTLATTLADFSPVTDESLLAKLYAQLTGAAKGAPLDLAGSQLLPVDFSDVDWCHCCYCRATPGGPITTEAFSALLAMATNGLRRHLAAAPLDGVWLDLHGAMFATGNEDAEGELVAAVRGVVGRDVLLSASFDLHGNFSTRLAENIDMATAYRTAPHIDVEHTRLKAMHMLARCVRADERPRIAYVAVPLAVSGEMSNTADEPSASLYSHQLHCSDAAEGVLDASLLVGYAWADEPRTGASVLVSGLRHEVAQREALRLAAEVWDQRAAFRFGTIAGPVDTVVRLAEEAAAARCSDALRHPVIISDSGGSK